jgi:hypothetical protein
VTVSASQRDEALAKAIVRPEDVLESPRKNDEAPNAPPKFDLKLRLEDRPRLASAIDSWIAGPWGSWSVHELPRRQTIALYQRLYRVFQLLELGSADSSIELIWGIGVVNWEKDGRSLDRPLLERRVEVELDDVHGGLIRVRPTSADVLYDLRPYEVLGCANLTSLSDLIRREIHRTSEEEGISPFRPESYETILSAAGSRLDPDGCYSTEIASGMDAGSGTSVLQVTNKWVLFARPRSQHVVLQDIDRLRRNAEDEKTEIKGLAERLVTEPARGVEGDGWKPLSDKIGVTAIDDRPAAEPTNLGDIFFPKPFNDAQIEIIRKLSNPETSFDVDIRQIDSRGLKSYAEAVIAAELPESFWTGMLPQLMDTSSSTSPYFLAYKAAQAKLGDKGFLSRDITVRDLLLNRSDVHHVFPRNYMKKKLGLQKGRYNQIANFVLAQSEINIAIGDDAPEDYFKVLRGQVNGGAKRYGGITAETDLRTNLRENCIPESMLDGNVPNYDTFLETRRGLMAQKIKTWFETL